MTEKPIAIVLGGTSPHVLLVNKLKQRGYYVVLIDYLDNPPAKTFADVHIKESTLDKDTVLSIAKEYNASLVISTCIDQANSVCCYVAEKLQLPHPYSYQTSLNVTDKGLMKKIMLDNGIPTSNYLLVKSIDEINWNNIQYPAVVKPVDCNSSKGVCRVDNADETCRSVVSAIEMSRTKTAIIEGYNEGEEIQVDCVVINNKAKVILTRQKQRIVRKGNEMVLQSFGSIIPAPLPDNLKEQAQDIAEKIASAFELNNTPFFYQAIVTTEGIKVLEFAPRIGGGLSYYMIKELAGFDAVEAAIQSYIGENINYSHKKLTKYYSSNLIYMKPGVFDHIDGLEVLKKENQVYETFVMKEKGTLIDSDMRSSNRVAAFIIEADTLKELTDKASNAFSRIEIYDKHKQPLLNRDVYPF